jgi:flagellar hook-length control protein FliK
MTFDMITTTAPASQPVLSDAPALAGTSSDDAAAFDAALSETLAVIDREALRDSGGQNDPATPPDWMFPVMFSMPVDEAIDSTDIEFATAPVGDEDETDIADLPSDSDDDAEIPADFVQLSFMPPAPGATTRIDVAVAGSTEIAGNNVDESLSVNISVSEFRPAAETAAASAATTEQHGTDRAAIRAVSAPTLTSSRISGDSRPAPPVPARDITETAGASETVTDRPASMPTAPATASSQRKMSTGHASQGWNAAVRAMADAARTQTTDAANAQAQAAVPGVEPAAVSPIATVVTREADAARTQASAPGADIAIQASGHDAPMTGDEQSNQGQPRQSADFVRFAAALSQLTAPDRDDTSRVVLASPATAPAASGAAAAPVIAPVAPAETSVTPGEDNVGRLVQAMRVNMRQGAWEATVRLNPEHLGDVTIALRVDRNSVSAVVNAEAAGVRQWLETQEQAVRSGMAEHGLQLDRFVVQRDGQRRDPQQQEPQPQSRRRQPKSGPAAAERFEIVV